jgi:molybdopterin molybdotransferase
MIPVEDALARVLALARGTEPEPVALTAALGRVLAEPAAARRNQPPFAAAAMDGYAIAGDAAPGMRFTVTGSAQAGRRHDGAVGPGQAVRIFTGAPVPSGATRIVIQEDVTRNGNQITLRDGLDAGPHIRPEGADFRAGDALPAGSRLRSVDLALLAAMNVATLAVRRRPVVAIIATGDELVMPGDAPGPDQIVASNLFALRAMVEAEGAEARILPIARDTQAALTDVLRLAQGADIIVTIGGASVGDHDLVGRVTGAMGMEPAFYKIAMRPGKPLMAGRLGGAAMLGLPGNPVSAIVCGHLFLLPLIRASLGLADPQARLLSAPLARALPANGVRAHYMRARLTATGIDPFEDQDSARLRLLAQADALLVRPVGDRARAAGEQMEYIAL